MKKLSKLLFLFGLILILIGIVSYRKDTIITFFKIYLSNESTKVEIDNVNDYYRDYSFKLVQNIKVINPKNYQDLLNTYYSIINSGKNEFTFYCDNKVYSSCLKDVEEIANNQTLLSNINNYTHPYNAFNHIETEFDSLGKVTIKIQRAYSKEYINTINKEVDKIYDEIIDNNLSNEENIKKIHDYIINNTKYDTLRSDQNIKKYHSDIAYGPLFEGYAICGGYTDLMQLFLEKLNLKSYRVSSHDHIWNAVEINNKWYHIDLTWDDPVTEDNKDYLSNEYLLITTDKLLNMEKSEHNYNQNIFLELKKTN